MLSGHRRLKVLAVVAVLGVAALVGAMVSGFFSGLGRSDPTTVGVVPISAEASALSGPGDVVVPGIAVPEQTQLVGQAVPFVSYPDGFVSYPDGEETRERVGWKALFVVTGDPVAAWSNITKSLDVGEAAAPTEVCTVSREQVTTRAAVSEGRRLTEPRQKGENALSCSFSNTSVGMSMKVGAHRRCISRFGNDDCSLVPVAHLEVTRDESAVAVEAPTSQYPTDGVEPSGAIVRPELPDDLSPRPLLGPGDGIDDGMDYQLWDEEGYHINFATFSIPEGGRSVVAPATLGGCTGSVTAMLEVDAAPQEAVRLIAEQPYGRAETTTGQWTGRDWGLRLVG